MGDITSRGVILGRTQAPRFSVPSELFFVYQPEMGHLATILWLNLRWAAQNESDFCIDDAHTYGIDESEERLMGALEALRRFGLLEDGPDGEWILHEPRPEEVFRLRYAESETPDRKNTDVRLKEPTKKHAKEQVKTEGSDARNGSVANLRSPLSRRRTRAQMLKLVDEQTGDWEQANEDMQAVVQIYHKRIGMMGPTQYEKLRFWVEEQGMEGAVVALAIEETVASAEVPRISYLEGILRNWYNDGIRTLAHVQKSKRASKVFAGSGGTDSGSREGVPNASAYRSVNPELVEKWKEMYPDEYDR